MDRPGNQETMKPWTGQETRKPGNHETMDRPGNQETMEPWTGQEIRKPWTGQRQAKATATNRPSPRRHTASQAAVKA